MRLSEDLFLTPQIRVSTDAAGTGVNITNLDESWQIHDSQHTPVKGRRSTFIRLLPFDYSLPVLTSMVDREKSTTSHVHLVSSRRSGSETP